jgi:hypothetical protein
VKVRGKPNEVAVSVIALLASLTHFFWCSFCLRKTWSDANGLPLKFSTVWCIDVLGFGLTTLCEVREPRAVNPLAQVKTFLAGGPTNTYTKEDAPEPEVSKELKRAVRKVEGTLQRLFARWQALDRDLSAAERVKLAQLQERFLQDRNALQTALNNEQEKEDTANGNLETFRSGKTSVRSNNDATPGSAFHPSNGWIRLHLTDDAGSRPYYLNVKTGEIRWDYPETEIDVKRGPSLLPEQLEVYETRSRALQEVQKEKDVGKTETKYSIARHQIPFELFKFGTIVVMIVWVAAFADTAYQAVKASQT